jgi:hypothetical protein
MDNFVDLMSSKSEDIPASPKTIGADQSFAIFNISSPSIYGKLRCSVSII